jgi:hypothetical protein
MSNTTNVSQENEESFLKLLKLWYKLIGGDHHKDRDCHFFIERHYCTYQKPVWVASHRGYISEFEGTYDSFIQAQQGLIEFLIEAIAQEIDSAEIQAREDLEYNSNKCGRSVEQEDKEYFEELRTSLNAIVQDIIWQAK